MRQIPLSLLPSTVAVRKPIDGEYGGEYEQTPTTIENVRYDGSISTYGGHNYLYDDGTKGVLFIDRVNSRGAFDIPAGSLLSIDRGDWVTAHKVHALKFSGAVHHWEIEVE